MNTAARWIITIAIGGTVAAAHVDAVLDWNKVPFEAVAAAKQAPPPTTRSMAIVREHARRGGRTLSQNARLFALMYLVL